MPQSNKINSPGTGKGPTSSHSPLSQRNGGADPNNIGKGGKS